MRFAAAQPACTAYDVRANVAAHANAVLRAGARVIAFPELSLTGYAMDLAPVALDDEALAPLVEACVHTRSVALVGAPIAGGGVSVHIATLRVDATGIEVAYRKTWLSDQESAHFSPGDGPTVLDVDGWRLGLAICKDTGSAQHTAATAALGVDVYVAGVVHLPEELAEQEARGLVIARTCRAHVVLASAAGDVGPDYRSTAGRSVIFDPNGTVVARAGSEAGEITAAMLGPDAATC